MKKIKRIALAIGLVLMVIIAGGWFYKNHIVQRARPVYQGQFQLSELTDSVEIFWDSIGMPHIYAKNEADLYFITGYISAQERLWQMDLLRRVTSGRLSEIFGEAYVNTDILLRMLRIPEKSRKMLEVTDSIVIKALKAYADGVNCYISAHENALPPEFFILGYTPEKWEIEHSLNLIGYIAWDLNGSWNSEVLLHKIAGKVNAVQYQTFIPNYDSTLAVIYSSSMAQNYWGDELLKTSGQLKALGLQVFHGSNNWAVAGSRSASGKPLLANDMHLGYSIPGTWFQIHQEIPGKLNVTGVMLPGEPFVVSGHNQRIAWGLTNVMNDDIDFYKETIHPQDSNSYKYDGKWLKMQIKNEAIILRGGDTVHANIRFTHRGPVVSGIKGVQDEVISMRWLGNEMSNEVRGIYYLNRADNWYAFRDAMKTFVSVSQNVAFADVEGNIGLYCCAGIPIRKAGNPTTILPGDTSAYDWAGIVPFDSLPYAFNPAQGFVVSANNKTIGASYPHYISNWFDLPYRYNRIYKLLRNDSLLDAKDFKDMQTDFNSGLVAFYLPTLLEVLGETKPLSDKAASAFAILKDWDGNMLATSTAASVFEIFYNEFVHHLVKDELGEKLFGEFITDKILVRHTFHNTWNNRGSVLCDDITTPAKETFGILVVQSIESAIASLHTRFGDNPDNWQWGNLHTLTLKHPLGEKNVLDKIFNLNRGPFPIGGSFHTVAPYTYKYSQLYKVSSGASERHVYDLNDWDASWSVIPTGNSGVPNSENYCNQTLLYLDGKYHHDWFTRDKIIENSNHKTVFFPGK